MDIDFSSQKIIPVDIQREMKKSYIDYAMSVIVGRALPDVRDGLKPVHRRILYTMHEAGYTPDKPHRKCATTVGDVLGKYHPHGDASVYDSLVRMAQDFSLRYPLVDGHGNFGSVDGDSAAAYRYTESRMSKLAVEMLTEIEKETVDYVPNYDESRKEPTVLPSRFPNLLLNGSSGIAVGMATNIPPHNLTEVINGVIAVIDNPELTAYDLMTYIKGPDFPTSGIIMGTKGIRDAFTTGRGRIVVRSRATIEPYGNRQAIIVTEIPYQVNKARLIEAIAELVKDKRVEGIADLRDESDRDGMRIVIEVKRDSNANVILNQLYKYTQLQDSFSVIMLALVKNQPKVLNLREILEHYIDHQKDIIVRRTKFDLKKAEARAHILEGLKIALDNIDAVIELIRSSKNVSEAKQGLMDRFGLSELQSQAIIDMRLGRLTGLEREKIENELNELFQTIERLKGILANEHLVMGIIKDELTIIKQKFGDERRTEIQPSEEDFNIEDLIEEEDNVITLTHFGYIKRISIDAYKNQRRGGRGITGISTREEDFVETLFVSSTHANLLFFTNKGLMYKMKGYEVPEAGRQAKGTAIVNMLELDPDEKVKAIIPVRQFEEGKFLVMLTKKGTIKKTDLTEYDTHKKNGLIAINIDEDDELIEVRLTDGSCDVIIGTYNGMSIRFNETDVRPMGRGTRGVKGINLRDNDYVVGMCIACENGELLTVTEKGMGKKTPITEYRTQTRAGIGIINYRITEKTGNVISLKSVTEQDDIIIITTDGTIIRLNTNEIRTCGRPSQGVKLMRTNDENAIAAIAIATREEGTDDVDELAGEDVTNEDSAENVIDDNDVIIENNVTDDNVE